MTITVMYSCLSCAVHRAKLDVPARGAEDVKAWMDATLRLIANDHRARNPHCTADKLSELMIPVTGRDRIGGPTLQ